MTNPNHTPRWHYLRADQILAELEAEPPDKLHQLAYLRGKLALAQLHAALAGCAWMQTPAPAWKPADTKPADTKPRRPNTMINTTETPEC